MHDAGDPLLTHWLAGSHRQAASLSSIMAATNSGSAPAADGPRLSLSRPPRPAKNAWLYDEGQALSDTLLRVLHLPSAKGETAQQLEAKRQQATHKEEYRLHSVVLAANSAYFRHRLLANTNSATQGLVPSLQQQSSPRQSSSGSLTPSSSHSDDGHPDDGTESRNPIPVTASEPKLGYVIEERLAPSDCKAAAAVLRHMYTEHLIVDSPSHLVSILKIADKWQVIDTVDACREAFGQLKPEDLDLDVIKQVYSLEGILHDVQNFAELVTAVQARMVTMFQDIAEVVQNPTSRNMFLQLPLAAVVALLRSPQLVVDSEDSVVVAANLWVTAGKGRNATQEQRRYLAGAVNLSGLSPAYMCGVLPNLRWFSPPGQPISSWAQVMPTAYYSEMQMRLVSGKAKQVLCANISTGPLTPSGASHSSSSSGNGQLQPTPLPSAPASASAPGARAPSSSHIVPAKGQAPTPLSTGKASVAAAADTAAAEKAGALGTTPGNGRVVRDQNLEIECDIEFSRLRQYLEDGHVGLVNAPQQQGFRGVHVHSQCSYFKGFMWGIKLVFGFSGGGQGPDSAPPTFNVTPSPFASLPPGEEGIRPLTTPISVSFRCTMEAVAGDKSTPYASATYQGASFLRPGEDHVSSIGIANFFKRVPQQHLPESWLPYLVDGKLRLRLRVIGSSVE